MIRNPSPGQRGAVDVGAALVVGALAAVSLVTLGIVYGERLALSLTGWQVFVILVLGVVFILIEAALPGFGVFGIAGLVMVAAAIFAAGAGSRDGWRALGVALISAPVLAGVLARLAIRRGYWKKLALQDSLTGGDGYVANRRRSDLLERTGKAVTALRPSGIAELDGKRVDVVTQGEYIEAGAPVRVIGAEGGRVIVAADPRENGGQLNE